MSPDLPEAGGSSYPAQLEIEEGKAIMLMPLHSKSLRIAAAVVDGKLSVTQLNSEGRSFSVTWSEPGGWQTATIRSDGKKQETLIDKDGDGFPDLKVVTDGDDVKRFDFIEAVWKEQSTLATGTTSSSIGEKHF